MSPPSPHDPSATAKRWLARHWREWGPYWVVAASLALISEMLWLWQTWPVRELLQVTSGST
jgi:hypothetical protein